MARTFAILFLCLTLAILWAQSAVGQQDEQPLGVPTEIEKAFKAETVFKILTSDNPSANDKAMLDTAAKYFVWRVTWLDNVGNPDKLALFLKEFDRDYTNRVVKNKDLKKEPVSFFNARLTEYFKAVFERKFDGNRVSTIQAAVMLPIVARSKDPVFGDFLTKIIKDADKHDAVKLYAVRAAREYFPLRPIGPNNPRPKNPADLERVQSLVGYIERKWPQASAKDELDAFSFLRREAVLSLAQVQAPALGFEKKQVEGEVAPALLKVLAKDILEPPPSLTEKCEAAIGICNMKLKDMLDYQPQLGIYASGMALSDFFNAYRADYANVAGKKTVGLLAYKNMADRFKNGLENLQSNLTEATGTHPASPFAKGLYDQSKGMLENIILHKPVDNQLAVDFRRWVGEKVGDKIGPKEKSLFKSNSALDVDLGY